MVDALADVLLEVMGWHKVDCGTEDSLELFAEPAEAEEADVTGEVHE